MQPTNSHINFPRKGNKKKATRKAEEIALVYKRLHCATTAAACAIENGHKKCFEHFEHFYRSSAAFIIIIITTI